MNLKELAEYEAMSKFLCDPLPEIPFDELIKRMTENDYSTGAIVWEPFEYEDLCSVADRIECEAKGNYTLYKRIAKGEFKDTKRRAKKR